MPRVPKISAGSGTMPGEASTMPTMAVNTIRSVTFGLVSSRYSRQRRRDEPSAASGGLSGSVDTAQGYHGGCGLRRPERRGFQAARPERAQQGHHDYDQEGGAAVVQRREQQRQMEMHHRDADADLQEYREHQQCAEEAQQRPGGARNDQKARDDQKAAHDDRTQAVREMDGDSG